MIPPFPIEGGFVLAAARAVSVAGLMAGFGGLGYRAWLIPADVTPQTVRRLELTALSGLLAAFAGALLWLVMQTLDWVGQTAPADMGTVLGSTQFGHLLAGRLGLLVLAAGVFALRRHSAAAILAGLALALQAGHSHAEAMQGAGLLLLSSGVHLLAAGAWLGALPPLLIVCACEPANTAASAARRYSPFGIICVAALAATAAFQSLSLVGDVPGLLGTAYGWMAGVKLGLFGLLVLLAAGNRRRHCQARFDAGVQIKLARSIAMETVAGLAIVLAAGVLSELPPAMHVQKLWPFAWTLSLDAALEDADYRAEILRTAAVFAAACCGLVAAWVFMRGWRRIALSAAAFIIIALCLPHAAPLAVPAVPTEFYASPTNYAAASIADGEPLYAAHCAVCHGAEGRGDGPAAHRLPIPPANLTQPHLFMHRDGEVFWWITHGMAAPDGTLAMPGVAGLPDDDVWALIDFIRARNQGLSHHGDGMTEAVRAPAFTAICSGGTTNLAALRGHIVRLVFGGAAPVSGVTTIQATSGGGLRPGTCMADPADIARTRRAYEIATGMTTVDGKTMLIDSNGWLRSMSAGDTSAVERPLPPAAATMPEMKM